MDVLFLKNWVVVDGSDVATISVLSTVVQCALPLPLRRKRVLFFFKFVSPCVFHGLCGLHLQGPDKKPAFLPLS